MLGNIIQFPIILLTGFISLGLSFPVTHLFRKFGLMDRPDSAPHKLHQQAIPFGGGIVLLISIWIGWIIFGNSSGLEVTGLLAAATVIMLWGLVDDARRLSPVAKLLGQIAATVLMILAGIQAHIFFQEWANILITVLWVVGLSNAFNFVDSMDGLALGLGIVAAGFFMLVTIDSGQPGLARLAAVMVGAGLGLMFLNTQPARLFLGDSGAQMLWFLLAAMGIAYNPAGLPQEVSWFTPILVLGVPIFDMVLVISTRMYRRTPVYQAGHDHTYHRLVQLGLDPNRAVVAMHMLSGTLGLLAFVILGVPAFWANTIFLTILLSGFGSVLWLEKRSRKSNPAEPQLADGRHDVEEDDSPGTAGIHEES